MQENFDFIQGLLTRWDGPMSFRLILQPIMAIIFAVRDGRRDAREGIPPYFWALFTNSGQRAEMLRSGWKGIGKVFIMAVAIDLIFQYLAVDQIRLVAALATGVVLAILPYLLLRGIVMRIFRRKNAEKIAPSGAGETT